MFLGKLLVFFSVLKQWGDARQNLGNALGLLQGGSTKCQTARGPKPNPVINNNFRKYTNTQQSHFVQGHITNPPFDQWPEIFKTSLCGTLHIPAPWNQAIDKSFDNVQKEYINKFNTGSTNIPQFTITASFVREYISAVQEEIKMDNELKLRKNKMKRGYQYDKMDQKDVKAQLDKLDQMKKDPKIIAKIVDDLAFDEKDSDCLYKK